MKIQWLRGSGVLSEISASEEAALLLDGEYQIGDCLYFESDTEHVIVQVDQAVAPAHLYLPEKSFTFRLPLDGDNPAVYAPGAFSGSRHLISLRPDPLNSYRNLAENPADQRGKVNAFPHASANVETRDESWFCARNTIDGSHVACGHGAWPFGSWGIGARTDAELTLDFGHPVDIDTLVLYLRADFPHDAYWIQGTLSFDDGTSCTFPLEGKDGPQRISLGAHRVRSLKLHQLIKCDMVSAFPALRQIEVYGKDAVSLASSL